MIDQHGTKICKYAVGMCWIGIILSIICAVGIAFWVGIRSGNVVAGLIAFAIAVGVGSLLSILGSLLVYLSMFGSLMIYGYGERIDYAEQTPRSLAEIETAVTPKDHAE